MDISSEYVRRYDAGLLGIIYRMDLFMGGVYFTAGVISLFSCAYCIIGLSISLKMR